MSPEETCKPRWTIPPDGPDRVYRTSVTTRQRHGSHNLQADQNAAGPGERVWWGRPRACVVWLKIPENSTSRPSKGHRHWGTQTLRLPQCRDAHANSTAGGSVRRLDIDMGRIPEWPIANADNGLTRMRRKWSQRTRWNPFDTSTKILARIEAYIPR